MASAFETAFQSQFNPAATSFFAETIAYKPSTSTTISVSAVVLRELRRRTLSDSGDVLRDEMEILVPVASVATPVDITEASGNGEDWALIDGSTFYVVEVLERAVGGWHRLRVATKVFI